jgi:hypothetical protein
MAARPQLQFSVAALLVTTTVLAVVLAGVAALNIPFSNPVVRGFLGGYFVFVAVWAVIRGPRVFSNFRDLSRRRRQLHDERAALVCELREIKASPPPREAPNAPQE